MFFISSIKAATKLPKHILLRNGIKVIFAKKGTFKVNNLTVLQLELYFTRLVIHSIKLLVKFLNFELNSRMLWQRKSLYGLRISNTLNSVTTKGGYVDLTYLSVTVLFERNFYNAIPRYVESFSRSCFRFP